MSQLTRDEVFRLINANSDLNKIAGHGGSILYTDTAAHTGLSATAVYVREDTVISALTGTTSTGATVNFLTLFNISGATLMIGDLYIAEAGYRINSMTLTSGSVILYL